MKVGIELNHIVRDVNTQVLKYFKKDIQKDFDDKSVDLNVTQFIENLPFDSKKRRNEFLYVDYAYEIFGCARTKHKNLANSITQWVIDTNNTYGNNTFDVIHFSLKENALTIQSSFYFLSKIGSRVREVFFPTDGKTMWEKCDVLITTNERIVMEKPSNKVVVLIKKNDNTNVEEYADLVYNDLLEVINDKDFVTKVNTLMSRKEEGVFKKITKSFKRMFK